MEISPGDYFGAYEIISPLGQGGQADVYKARAANQSYVAIKVLRSGLAAEEDFVRRFEREAAIISSLNHTNIVRVIEFVAGAQRPYMVMEFVEGETLDARLRRLRQAAQIMPASEVVRVLNKLALAIDYAHSLGMIHRDLKPSNIMFRADDEPVLMDFGIARILGAARFTQSGMLMGTPAYMAPEQCQGEGGDRRSDLYALGVMAYEMACGQLPFVNDNPYGLLMMHINQPPPLPTRLNPVLGEGVQQALLKALSKLPDKRHASASQFAESIRMGVEHPEMFHVEPVEPLFDVLSPILPNLADQTAAPTASSASRRMSLAPFQAPPEVDHFVGRERAVENLRALCTARDKPVVVSLVGMGGIGKTALAVQLAHRLKSQFPGGVLWANMANSEPMAVLQSWAQAYGCDFSGLPDLSSRAAALRGVLHGERVLFILDDISAGQPTEVVRKLLLGGPGSVMLLTTRSMELAAAFNAKVAPVDVLDASQSLELMRFIAGDERVNAEIKAAREICEQLGNLPLAVEIAAQRLASHRRLSLADFVFRLRQEKGRLAELRLSDREVRASFAVSYQVLETGRQRAFQYLGVFAGRLLTPAALAAVAELEMYRAEDHLYALEAVSLVQAVGSSHYRQHPLLADFARELLGPDHLAEMRMIEYYLEFVRKYSNDSKTLEEEEENLSASLQAAFQQQAWATVLEFARLLSGYWFVRGLYSEARQNYARADEAARQLGSPQGDPEILYLWGRACMEQKDYTEASSRLRQAQALYHAQQDDRGEASAQVHLARIALEHGEYDQARALLTESQLIRQKLDDQAGLAEVLYTSARIDYFHGDFEQALLTGRQALNIQNAVKDQTGAVLSLSLLASIAFERGKFELADDYALQALTLCDQLNNKPERVQPLLILGDVRRKQNQVEEAIEFYEIGLDLLKKIGDLVSQAEALYSLSKAYLTIGDLKQALTTAKNSLDLCDTSAVSLLNVYILLQLGDVYQKMKQPDLARSYWLQARNLAETIEAAKAIRMATTRLENTS